MFSRLPIVSPLLGGIAKALATVALGSSGAYFFFRSSAAPASPELLRATAGIGATLLIAYVVEAVWLASRVEVDEEVDDEYEEWLGFLVGTGIAGFVGVGTALLLSEHRAAGHFNFVDQFGTAWIMMSLLILGSLLLVQPVFAHWLRTPSSRVDDSA